MFDPIIPSRRRSITIITRFFTVMLAVYLVIGMISAYRAWYQVKSLALRADNLALKSGSMIQTDVVSYARGPIDLRVELVQGQHRETIATKLVRGNEWGFFDPRSRQDSLSATMTADVLQRFTPGKATLRVTATGREQWTRLPPPMIRELAVEIAPRQSM